MGDASRLLEVERQLERSFAADEAALGHGARGSMPSVMLFHFAHWRERLRDALVAFEAGSRYAQPHDIDDMPAADGEGLGDAAARSDSVLGEMIELSARLGGRYFQWPLTRTCGDAIMRNSYFQPRVHLAAYWHENGEGRRAQQLVENTARELRELWPAPIILGAGLYNLATLRVAQGRYDDALDLLDEVLPMRPGIRTWRR